MFNDQTPEGVLNEFWTIALVCSGTTKEVHFGAFPSVADAREAMESGNVRTREDETLELRRIRRFPV